jgi:hypothetical protein
MITSSTSIGSMYNIGMVIQSMMSLITVKLYIISRPKDGNEYKEG